MFFVVLRGPSWPKEGVLRGPSRLFVDKKRCSSWSFVALRGSKEGFLRGPSRPFVDQQKVFFVPLRDSSWIKRRFSSCPFATLRGSKEGFLRAPSRLFVDQKKVFFVVLRGPSWIKKRCSPRPFVDTPNYDLTNLSSNKRQRALKTKNSPNHRVQVAFTKKLRTKN